MRDRCGIFRDVRLDNRLHERVSRWTVRAYCLLTSAGRLDGTGRSRDRSILDGVRTNSLDGESLAEFLGDPPRAVRRERIASVYSPNDLSCLGGGQITNGSSY